MVRITLQGARGFKKGHGRFRSEESYQLGGKKISIAKKGVKFSEEHKRRLSECGKGKNLGNTNGFKKGFVPWNKGKIKEGGITHQPGYASFRGKRRRARKLANGGSHTLGDWNNLKAQYNFTCPSCKISEPEIKLTEDHIIPLSKGGSDNIENIQPLCLSCNDKKHMKIIKYERG